ncbi:degradation enzyme regulation protein DegQ [Metabacillus arenae]|uniref:Degradation enzyme regulation protein DegQ n=1 Tax=Metabacillus arenae TaxID=2771434 RepID=A0A926NAY8_9BACI|nr:degradation enzyme regulation protein DegQ [Metabacillus arenae]MBD1380872.1 Degradation enzyme regulation protein DegQ [Metabacillus arenae]
MNHIKIEELKQLLNSLEKEIKETKDSLRLINKSIDKYDKYNYIKVS